VRETRALSGTVHAVVKTPNRTLSHIIAETTLARSLANDNVEYSLFVLAPTLCFMYFLLGASPMLNILISNPRIPLSTIL